ncbi:bifunctional DNA-formamidopyrimidine glycosylase/DNA-(apurinic or apyrimidinic site) lyase [Patescibacteria group bacterium]|nr:bifunctional DNA-formamidopyrimidine glycosylase/DNA-(apurinic or apyrimidinic site) lyase [Patescibacteria group bacterium]
MPELPEVETVKNDLKERIIGKKIKEVWLDQGFKKNVFPSASIKRKLKALTIEKVDRKAKLLIITFDQELFLLIHLKMTGQLVFEPKRGQIVSGGHEIVGATEVPNKFTRAILKFSDGTNLYFNDLRKFGFMKLTDRKGLDKELEKYGMDPLEKEFDFAHFNSIMDKRPNNKIKIFLMNQKLISGIGNIYADEICFASGILPFRLIRDISIAERKKLFKKIKEVLKSAIGHGGTSVDTYVRVGGQTGNFQKLLKVYGREGMKCKKCTSIIKRIKLGGRSSCFCPVCQK